MLHRILDIIAPDLCQLCRQPVAMHRPHGLCQFCWRALPRIAHACIYCALPQARSGICSTCHKPGPRHRSYAPLRHEEEGRYLLHRFKYHRDLRAGAALACAIQTRVTPVYSYQARPQCLIPVPLSWRRQVARGFNQAEMLAQYLGRRMNIPVRSHDLTRRHGPRQATRSRQERLGLDPDTFRVRRPLRWDHVAIVDDVLTTGATTAALAHLLVCHGVRQVDIWCATRAVNEP